MSSDNICEACKHSQYEHIDWKAGTKYATNNQFCRIVRCDCPGYKYTPPASSYDWCE